MTPSNSTVVNLVWEQQAMVEKNSCVAVYSNHLQAEEAVGRLLARNFDTAKLSIVGRGFQREEQAVGYYNSGGQPRFWGMQRAFWNRLWERLPGAAFFWLPGPGPVVMAGPLAGSLVAVLKGDAAVNGLSVLGAALSTVGIPKGSIIHYERAIKAAHYLVMVHGSQAELERAHDILAESGARDVTLHLG